jgi:vancomycin resistance protein YoaR
MQRGEFLSTITSKISGAMSFRPTVKQWGICVGILLGLLVAVNVAIAAYYQGKFYPHLSAGAIQVGGMTKAQARGVIADHLERQPVVLAFDRQIVKLTAQELGVTYDVEATMKKLEAQPQPALPMLAFLPWRQDIESPLIFTVDSEVYSKRLAEVLADKDAEPIDAKLTFAGGNVRLEPHKAGRRYQQKEVEADIAKVLKRLSPEPVEVVATQVPVKVTAEDLRPALTQADDRLETSLILKYGDREISPDQGQIGSWLTVNDQLQVEVVEAQVAKYIEEIAVDIDVATKNEIITTLDGVETGRTAGAAGKLLNRTETLQAILKALSEGQDLTYELQVETVQPAVEYVRKTSFRGITYNYCIKANSVDAAKLGVFSQKITATLADARGWGMNGLIRFQEVANGCAFNLVLAASHTLPTYNPVCSVEWSCRVGQNVIINETRWDNASPSWNQAGGSLNDYRSMVINHEVGHYLGFGEGVCPAAGQIAPVMLQQSIGLYGCAFNPWPTQAELNQVRRWKGI